MSILVKPYEITIWNDIYSDNGLEEVKVATIGSNEMLYQGRALEPNLIKNVNGTKSFTFKMYKYFIDTTTGEKIQNSFSDWLVVERKVKLEYDGEWYDFIVKDINENSADYLFTYTLEDALVQELSKNGFGITLNADLMNNMGSAKEIGKYTMKETDWQVESEFLVESVEESLIYISLPDDLSNYKIYRLRDQTAPYSSGIEEDLLTENEKNGIKLDDLKGKTILAFYSSCKNKPNRFQFIYKKSLVEGDNNPYGKNLDGTYKIMCDDRFITEPNCQYFIEFNSPDEDYKESDSGNAKDLGLFLPKDFKDGVCATYHDINNILIEQDSALSAWYRGKRYAFSQQAVYVPVLERYCQKFYREEELNLTKNMIEIYAHTESVIDGKVVNTGFECGQIEIINNKYVSIYDCVKKAPHTGIKLNLNQLEKDSYIVEYTLKITSGVLKNIGGYGTHFKPTEYWINGQSIEISDKDDSYVTVENKENTHVKIKYIKRDEPTNSNIGLYIQPNRGEEGEIGFEIYNLSITQTGDYLGYEDTKFISPTLVQNYVNNYDFQSTGGWIATSSAQYSSSTCPTVQNVYGLFNNQTFTSIVDDFYQGSYDEANDYKAYMKISLFDKNQFVLNSGIKDNRIIIENIPIGEEWILDYNIVNSMGISVNEDFEFSLGEYIYDTKEGIYKEKSSSISFIVTNKSASRIFFKVTGEDLGYNSDNFKKNSSFYLKIQCNNMETNGQPAIFYIEKIALYRKSLDEDGNIIAPDYSNKENIAVENYLKASKLEHKYIYFNEWQVNQKNTEAITDKKYLKSIVKDTLNYTVFKPVYNTQAEKIRAVTQQESNYFNILQSIAETFEAWLSLEIERDGETGAVRKKTVWFRNYSGGDNYANFQYGVNLKDIQRTQSSKNIVTKLIVKQATNELAKNGYCSIARAGANPTGENYIYDFQYYQNCGIMKPEDYLNTVYYLGVNPETKKAIATGPDAKLWNDETKVTEPSDTNPANANGYYIRLKEINRLMSPISEQISGLNIDLTKKKAALEVAEATHESSISGAAQIREDFLALTGIYPEEAQDGKIERITPPSEGEMVSIQQDWWELDGEPSIQNDSEVVIKLKVQEYEKICGTKVVSHPDVQTEQITGGYINMDKAIGYSGLYLEEQWELGRKYTLTYDLKVTDGTLVNIGGHCAYFTDYEYKVIINGKTLTSYDDYVTINEENLTNNGEYRVIFTGKYAGTEGPGYAGEDSLWIQPNRGQNIRVKCEIGNISLTKTIESHENTKDYDRTASFYLNTDVYILGKTEPISRTYSLSCRVPANTNSAELTQEIRAIDIERSDIKKYIEEYGLYLKKKKESLEEIEKLNRDISNLETSIKSIKENFEELKGYKTLLNNLFFKKYSRFILEGTWIGDQYVDDEKYFADAQSVMYNSCYPQVEYTINVISLKGIPEYELFDFKLGDKTYVVDEQFFGNKLKEEVIISEISENLDDPSKNTIKVQNFKNQFQDLFQKITATVQQTNYNVGSYKKGAALIDANINKQNQFITNAINNATTYLQYGQTVETGESGIIITDKSDKHNKLRLVGGAILFSIENPETKETTWMTGITNQGISANLITAGRLDTGAIQIMSGEQPVFRWDAYGISAYDAYWSSANGIRSISGINTKKFVRFDKNGLYGINDSSIDGISWAPSDDYTNGLKVGASVEIDDKAVFSLTWEGLKVKNDKGVTLRIGDSAKIGSESTNLLDIRNSNNETVFAIDENGSAKWTPQSTATKKLYKVSASAEDVPNNFYDNYPLSSDMEWHRQLDLNDYYYSESNDGGNTWSIPILFRGEKGEPGDPGQPGEPGVDYFNCFVESNRGTLIESSETGDIVFTARIFKGTTELDTQGDKFTYKWYVNDILQEGEVKKTLTLPIQEAIKRDIRFIAEENTIA